MTKGKKGVTRRRFLEGSAWPEVPLRSTKR